VRCPSLPRTACPHWPARSGPMPSGADGST
jgi:hypothetical protein